MALNLSQMRNHVIKVHKNSHKLLNCVDPNIDAAECQFLSRSEYFA